MPKLTDASRNARRDVILRAARSCFAAKGFRATTIADICRVSGLSAGGIYVHFENKHAIAAAIGRDATAADPADTTPQALLAHLMSPGGTIDARLDVQLWAEALHDAELHEMVESSMDAFRERLSGHVPSERRGLVEALALGLEVQRALGREIDVDDVRRALDEIIVPTGGEP